MKHVDVAVIGGGPAGLAAALEAEKMGVQVLLVEREDRLGGILKQCVHDGFGLVRYNEKLTGPEYAQRDLNAVQASNITTKTSCFVTSLRAHALGWQLMLTQADGVQNVLAKSVVLATGCRERTARQVAIHGTRPAGVLTAGAAQYYVNRLGQLPARRCVVLGSGDIGLIMARRLTLEGARVLGVFEAKGTPSGLPRNLAQCLRDFDIPLHLHKTVTRCFGEDRLTAVEVAQTDDTMRPIPGTEEMIPCDGLILSVGLIPENELAESIGLPLVPATSGPAVDQNGMTEKPGIFCCGNAAHVNDLVDYVSESGGAAGRKAATFALHNAKHDTNGVPIKQTTQNLAAIVPDEKILYAVPQRISLDDDLRKTVLFFRARQELGKTRLNVRCNGVVLLRKNYQTLRPPEMERIVLDLSRENLREGDEITLELEVLA
ncbi:MAG: NAD(P)/FAD-dependent oxidoreductase [Oscillospiraceae bacterium]|jgi:thioredoxin reductase|nr:NAD(P)/FAD-dependent oxidoreductase [Oscillospiraceae bacterium]